ncbi:MAG: anti-sigma factor antagonist [Anaeroplasma sp.]
MGLNVGVYIKQDVLILRLKGDLDDISVSDLRLRIARYIDDYKIKHLVINAEKLEFLDSSGIGFIIGRYHQLKKVNGDITLCCINSKVERIVILSGLAKICSIRDNEQSVLVSLGGR